MAGRLLLLMREEQQQDPRNNRIFRDRRNPIDFCDDIELCRRYRFDRTSIFYLTDLLSNDLNRTRRTAALLPVQQVMITLRYYATGTFRSVCGDEIGVNKATANRAIWTVTSTLVRRCDEFIKFPNEDSTDLIKAKFFDLAGFPGVLGCVDGTQIRIQRPSVNENDYINRKFFPSINVQGICDFSCKFLNIVANRPGSAHDAFIWSTCRINAQFVNGRNDGYLLGDSGYPCKPWLLTPFHDPQCDRQKRYNKAHRSTRVKIEQAFGMLKRRFHLLHGEIRVRPSKACKLIVAASVLHNVAIERHQPDQDAAAAEYMQGIEVVEYEDIVGPDMGKNYRQRIVDLYFS